MPFIKLQFKPGVNRDQTDYSNEGGWYECDKIRFRSGYPEKIGGWVKTTPTAFSGVCRQMWNWITTYNDNLLSLGTDTKVYIENGGYYYDITPFVHISSPALDNVITATNGSSILTIEDTQYTPYVGDYVVLSGCTSLGGNVTATILNTEFEILSVNATAQTYTISVAPVVADSSDTLNGGNAITYNSEWQISGAGALLVNSNAGTAGQVLTSAGVAAAPQWTTLGTMSSQNANAVAITGGSITGTPISGSTVGGTTITASTQFSGPGTGLTGTATSLNIGGNAATATTATSASEIGRAHV